MSIKSLDRIYGTPREWLIGKLARKGIEGRGRDESCGVRNKNGRIGEEMPGTQPFGRDCNANLARGKLVYRLEKHRYTSERRFTSDSFVFHRLGPRNGSRRTKQRRPITILLKSLRDTKRGPATRSKFSGLRMRVNCRSSGRLSTSMPSAQGTRNSAANSRQLPKVPVKRCFSL